MFKAWDGIDRGALPEGSAKEIALSGRNDLETPAIELCPSIAEVLEELAKDQAWLTRMSGSGATCYALYDTIEARDDAAKDRLAEAYPSWWTLAGKLR